MPRSMDGTFISHVKIVRDLSLGFADHAIRGQPSLTGDVVSVVLEELLIQILRPAVNDAGHATATSVRNALRGALALAYGPSTTCIEALKLSRAADQRNCVLHPPAGHLC